MRDQKREAWFALWVLFGINLMNFYDRQIIAAVTEPIRKEWQLSDTAMGTLGTVFTLIYAAVGVPLGRLADRWSRVKILSLGLTFWSFLTAASGAAWNYWSLFVTRLGVGVGEASCAPAANSLIGDLYPPHQRARALSIFMMGLPVGLFLSYLFSGMIAQAFGWRAAFYIALIPGLALAALALLLQEPPRGAAEVYQDAGRQREGSPYRLVLSIPTMWWIIAAGALHTFNMYAVNSFCTAFLSRYHGLNIRAANNVSAFALGAVGVVGLLWGGWLADRLHRVRANGRLLLASFSLLASAPCIYFSLGQPPGEVVGFMILMGLGSMLMYVYYATVYAAIQDVVEPSLRGTAMALYFFAMYVLGASLGPVGTGMLSDYFAMQLMHQAGATELEPFKAAGLRSAMHLIPWLNLALAAVLFAASRTVATDMEKMQRWLRGASEKPSAIPADAAMAGEN